MSDPSFIMLPNPKWFEKIYCAYCHGCFDENTIKNAYNSEDSLYYHNSCLIIKQFNSKSSIKEGRVNE